MGPIVTMSYDLVMMVGVGELFVVPYATTDTVANTAGIYYAPFFGITVLASTKATANVDGVVMNDSFFLELIDKWD